MFHDLAQERVVIVFSTDSHHFSINQDRPIDCLLTKTHLVKTWET